MEQLRRVIETEHPTVIFVLGDIVHFHLFNLRRYWHAFYSQLETLGIEIHIIPGNHDRYLHGKVVKQYHSTNVHPHQNELIIVHPPGDGRKVVLGHDLRNDKRVHGTTAVRLWFAALRATFARAIDPDALLVLGHVHERISAEDGLTESLLPFSFDYNAYGYGIVEMGHDGVLSTRFHP
jgi:DNA repair exonuclease SbcCD nuclease subunit